MRVGQMVMVGLAACFSVPVAVQAEPVFLICSGSFVSERSVAETIERVELETVLNLTVDLDQETGQPMRLRAVPAQRSLPIESLDLRRDAMPVHGAGMTRFRVAEDAVLIRRTEQSGPVINAVVGANPHGRTPLHLHEVELRLNRFSGMIRIQWYWHQVRDYRPVGAIRTLKKRYSDRNQFDGDCDLMKARLF